MITTINWRDTSKKEPQRPLRPRWRVHLDYLKYIIRHKWYVAVECWEAITHDLSKFLPCEWWPYAYFFCGGWSEEECPNWLKLAYDRAWNHHQKSNPHHWQYWLLQKDSGELRILEMPERKIIEMLCDWHGAGLAITDRNNTQKWYLENQDSHFRPFFVDKGQKQIFYSIIKTPVASVKTASNRLTTILKAQQVA